MFSALGSLFITRPREAESADARLEIRRHDPEHERRKPKKHDRNEAQIFGDDDIATVSVAALSVFLSNFLDQAIAQHNTAEASGERIDVPNTAATPQTERPERPGPRPARSEQAARAMNAYGTTAHATEKAAAQQPPHQTNSESALSAEDTRTIHVLLRDLQILSENKIEFLTIERSGSFLQSLVHAVEKAKP
jgi:hypothetical protein